MHYVLIPHTNIKTFYHFVIIVFITLVSSP